MTTAFPFETTVDIRAQDFDPMGHVNNVAYGVYREEARERYLRATFDKGLTDDLNTVTARSSIEYHHPIPVDHEQVIVGIQAGELGEKSISLDYEIHAGNQVAATGEMVQVAYSRSARESVPIPERWRQQIQEAGR
jgi:acyl-CoA thioester hydrolase